MRSGRKKGDRRDGPSNTGSRPSTDFRRGKAAETHLRIYKSGAFQELLIPMFARACAERLGVRNVICAATLLAAPVDFMGRARLRLRPSCQGSRAGSRQWLGEQAAPSPPFF